VLRRARQLCEDNRRASRSAQTVPGHFAAVSPMLGMLPVSNGDMSFVSPYRSSDQLSMGHLSSMPNPMQLHSRPPISHSPLIGFPWGGASLFPFYPTLNSLSPSISGSTSQTCSFAYPPSNNSPTSPSMAFEIPWGWS